MLATMVDKGSLLVTMHGGSPSIPTVGIGATGWPSLLVVDGHSALVWTTKSFEDELKQQNTESLQIKGNTESFQTFMSYMSYC